MKNAYRLSMAWEIHYTVPKETNKLLHVSKRLIK
jgi:hypothetical protein